MLIILDGWGIGERPEVDAVATARTPYYDHLIDTYPNTTLTTFGQQVGLPSGQMGNSEVGHLNLGAGRVVYQELARINKAIEDQTLQEMPKIQQLIAHAKEHNKPIHLMGLLSDGGVHSHINHVKALCRILKGAGVERVYVHGFLDGRDTDPQGGEAYVSDLLTTLDETGYKLASLIGRYYAMDRDLRWERIKEAYDLLVHGHGILSADPVQSLKDSYARDITDEFIAPTLCDPEGIIQDGDGVLFFNFRTDRPRQITRALSQEDFVDHDMHKLAIHMVTMTNYDQNYEGVHVVYDKEDIKDTIGEVVSRHGLSQVRIAETEKYPHVTFFFNGGREAPFEKEDRIVIPSPKVATYDLAPEMSAAEVTEAIVKRMNEDPLS